MAGEILTLNAGSSSIKFSLFRTGSELKLLFKGSVESIGIKPYFSVIDQEEKIIAEEYWEQHNESEYDDCIGELLDWLKAHGHHSFAAVGHRVVHGGQNFTAPVRINDSIVARLDALSPLAPLHQPHNLSAIRIVQRLLPDVAQVACFDTAFHNTMVPVVTRFGLPRVLADEGIRRYGFHGLSYEYIAQKLASVDPALAKGRVIVAHLGNGASLCAMHMGGSVDTTMGFSALDGLVMGTRCGSLDPEVILYLMREKGMSAAEVESLLYHQCGLLGVSGISSDMRDLLASGNARAKEAVELFVFRIVRDMGALTSTLGGLDGIVFTAGIGEHAPEIRRMVCERLGWLGAGMDENANQSSDTMLHTAASRIKILMIPTDEEAMIAQHTVDAVEN